MDSSLPVSSIEEKVFSNQKEDNAVSVLETLSSSTDEANQIINKIALNKMIDNLMPRDKQVILLRYFKDKTQKEVAKILDISQVQVSRIEKRILNQMKEELA